jgi:hypothetical protein
MESVLAPVLAAGLAIQQFLEIFDKIINISDPDKKKRIYGAISLFLGLFIAFMAELQIFKALGLADINIYLDYFVTGVIISGGTEGINSIMKFLGYTKNKVKNIQTNGG